MDEKKTKKVFVSELVLTKQHSFCDVVVHEEEKELEENEITEEEKQQIKHEIEESCM